MFQHNTELLSSGETHREKARKLIAKVVNVLGVKIEIGGPFICSYLLGFPDHYTNRKFVVCYWQSFVSFVHKSWDHNDPHIPAAKVQIRKRNGVPIPVSPVDDYIYRPDELSYMSLYDFVCLYYHKKIPAKKKSGSKSSNNVKGKQRCEKR